MTIPTHCPVCQSEHIYQDSYLWICPTCSHEWSHVPTQASSEITTDDTLVRDANGNILTDGDTVVLVKDLKIKGSSSSIKGGTKVKNIRLFDVGDGHNITCKIEGFGAMNLKSEFVRKL